MLEQRKLHSNDCPCSNLFFSILMLLLLKGCVQYNIHSDIIKKCPNFLLGDTQLNVINLSRFNLFENLANRPNISNNHLHGIGSSPISDVIAFVIKLANMSGCTYITMQTQMATFAWLTRI